jgi:hypothetical protein
MNNNLKRILNLSKKTGDKVVVVPENEKEEPFVVVPFSVYEASLNQFDGEIDYAKLSEKEMFDKVNRDLINWRQSQIDSDETDLSEDQDELYNLIKKREESKEEDFYDDYQDDDELEAEEVDQENSEKVDDKWLSVSDVLIGGVGSEKTDWLDEMNQEETEEDLEDFEEEDLEPIADEQSSEKDSNIILEPESLDLSEVVYKDLDSDKSASVPTIDESFDEEDKEEKEADDSDDFSTEPDDLLI